MGVYIETNLLDGEKVLYEERVSLMTLVLPGLLGIGVVLLMGAFAMTFQQVLWPALGLGVAMGLFVVAGAWLRYMMTEMAITDRRVIAKTGFIYRDSVDLRLGRIESIQVDQSVLGRILNYGTIIVGGAGAPAVPIAGIDNPLAFRKAFYEIQEKHSRF